MLGIRQDGADVVRTAQSVRRAPDGKELVAARDCITAIADILRSLIRCIQQTKCHLAGRSRQLASPRRIDNPASMHAGPHVAVATRTGDVEESHALHEEGTLLGIKNRKALVDLHLE